MLLGSSWMALECLLGGFARLYATFGRSRAALCRSLAPCRGRVLKIPSRPASLAPPPLVWVGALAWILWDSRRSGEGKGTGETEIALTRPETPKELADILGSRRIWGTPKSPSTDQAEIKFTASSAPGQDR